MEFDNSDWISSSSTSPKQHFIAKSTTKARLIPEIIYWFNFEDSKIKRAAIWWGAPPVKSARTITLSLLSNISFNLFSKPSWVSFASKSSPIIF